MATHKCPGPGCSVQVSSDMLACRVHWFKIPRGLRNRIWAAWKNGEGAGSDEHTAAVAEAVEFLQKTGSAAS